MWYFFLVLLLETKNIYTIYQISQSWMKKLGCICCYEKMLKNGHQIKLPCISVYQNIQCHTLILIVLKTDNNIEIYMNRNKCFYTLNMHECVCLYVSITMFGERNSYFDSSIPESHNRFCPWNMLKAEKGYCFLFFICNYVCVSISMCRSHFF